MSPHYPEKPARICKDCKYMIYSPGYDLVIPISLQEERAGMMISICNYPTNVVRYDRVTGKPIYKLPRCSDQRDCSEEPGKSACTFEGKWFEPKAASSSILGSKNSKQARLITEDDV